MKKDIIIPKVKDVYVAAVKEFNEEFKTYDWNAYLINDKDTALEIVFIVSKGKKDDKETATMRHRLDKLPPKSYAKIEFLEDSVLALDNQFKVSFFEDNTLFDKTYTFKAHSIHEDFYEKIPLLETEGVLAS